MNTPKSLIDFYINILTTMQDNIQDKTPEEKNLYMLSFFGLLRSGYPHQVTETEIIENVEEDPKKKKKDTKKKTKKNNVKVQEVQEEDNPTIKKIIRTVNIVIKHKGYSMDENELRAMFGKQYDLVMNPVVPEEDYDPHDKDNDDFILPEFPEEGDDTEKRQDSSVKSNVPAAKTKKTIPYIQSDSNYPDDKDGSKDYDTFLFNSHNIKVTYSNGSHETFTAAVYPLTMDTSDTIAADIFVIVTDEQGRIRSGMSDMDAGGQKGVVAEFENCSLIIRAEWRGGKFISKANIFSTPYGIKAFATERVSSIEPTRKTSSFYLRIKGNNGNYLNVFPMSLLHNDPSTGLAATVVMIEDGYSRKIYSGDTKTYLSLWFDKSQKKINIFWAGNSLNVAMEEE